MNRFNLKMALAALIGMASIFTSSCSKEDENDNGKADTGLVPHNPTEFLP